MIGRFICATNIIKACRFTLQALVVGDSGNHSKEKAGGFQT